MGETNPQEWPWVMVGPFPLLAEPSYDPGIQGETSVKVCVGDTPMRLLGTHASPHRIVIRRDRSAPGPRPEAEQDAETA